MVRLSIRKVPLKIHVFTVLLIGASVGTVLNAYQSNTVNTNEPPASQAVAAATTSANHTSQVIYRGSPKSDAYVYEHPTAHYKVEVPAQWHLGFIGTSYNPHLATVLHSPDFQTEPLENGGKKITAGAEIFIYVEPPRAKTPTMESEFEYLTSLGETAAGPRSDIAIDGLPAINYFRDLGGTTAPYQTAIVAKENRMYRFLYRTYVPDGGSLLEAFALYQNYYDRILGTFVLPAEPPSSKFEYL